MDNLTHSLRNSKRAFTLVEVLLMLGIMMSAGLTIVSITSTQLQRSEVENYANDIQSTIGVIRQHAFTGKNNTNHGIAFFGNQYVVFSGNDYASRVDEEIRVIPDDISLTSINFNSGNILIFQKSSIRPANAGSLIITDGNVTFQITINVEGLAEILET